MADPVEDLLPLIGVQLAEGVNRQSDSSSDTSSGSDDNMSANESENDEDDEEDENENNEENAGVENRIEELEVHDQEFVSRHRSLRNRLKNLRYGRKKRKRSREQTSTNFDISLPGAHAYLGNDLEELRGRTIFDEGSLIKLPMMFLPTVVLVPGQMIPLQLYSDHLVNMVRRTITTNKTFGILNEIMLDSTKTNARVGCTAELLSLADDYDEPSGISGIRAIARGRQRFQILGDITLEINRDINAVVKILPEISLTHVLNGVGTRSLRALAVPPSEDESDIKTALDRKGNVLTTVDLRQKNEHNKFSWAYQTPWPPWMYKSYDIGYLSEQIRDEVKDWVGNKLPSDPVELSYWVAHNLPIEDKTRIFLLSINSVVQRLRYGLSIIKKSGKVLNCAVCEEQVANKENVFSMTQEGPLSTFVNPGGYVHEMFTVLRVEHISTVGGSSTEHSWFPGYAWTIAQCSSCYSHIGWLFTATKRSLTPKKFYGICRPAVRQSFDGPDLDEKTLVM